MTRADRIVSGRAELAVEISGAGDPVVFLHANVCDSRMWRAQLDAASKTHKTIAYDRRGFGGTVAEKEDHDALADLLAVLEASADGKPVVLVGCSQGGRIAIDAALACPGRVRALFLVAPSLTGAPDPIHPPGVAEMMAVLKSAEAAGDLDQVNRLKARIFLDGPTAPEGRVGGEVRQLFLDMNGIALRSPPIGRDTGAPANFDRLGGVARPTLVVQGDLDLPHVQERSRRVAENAPDGALHVIEGSAHLPSLDRPADVTALLTAFLAGPGDIRR